MSVRKGIVGAVAVRFECGMGTCWMDGDVTGVRRGWMGGLGSSRDGG